MMGEKAIKHELIEWLKQLDDVQTIEYLKVVKDARNTDKDWGHDLSDQTREGIERGMKDARSGRTIAHDDVKKKHGL